MRSHALPQAALATSLALATCLGLAACGTSDALGPVQPDEVSITVAVTGGLAGVDYAIRIDGVMGEVRGVRCMAFCDFEAGEVIIPISPEQVTELAGLLDDAGSLELDGRDFGLECCDQFHFSVTYERGERSALFIGTESLLPRDIQEALTQVLLLARRVLPAIYAPNTQDTDWPRDAYTLGPVLLSGSELSAEVTYSGGCAQHRMDLVVWGLWLETAPVQINALVTHDSANDPCDALVAEVRRFDLTPLREAYTNAYGPPVPGDTALVLRLWDPLAASPTGRLIEVAF